MTKEWKQISDYDKYWCSDNGEVTNKDTGVILRQSLGTNGYLKVSLSKNSVVKTHYIHRIVASVFLGECPDKRQVNHKNGIKTDNRVENLEYVTPLENTAHAIENSLRCNAGEGNGRSKLLNSDIPNIRRDLASGKYTQQEIADKYHVKKNAISQIKLGTTWGCIEEDEALDLRSGAEKKAVEIRELLDSGELSQAEIARRVGVSPATVSNVKKGKRWSDT